VFSENYDPIKLAGDVAEFLQTDFGRYYMERLDLTKQRSLAKAMNFELSDTERAHAATRAATINAEQAFFMMSKAVNADPKLHSQLMKGIERREAKEAKK
jgi:hypothetical protein